MRNKGTIAKQNYMRERGGNGIPKLNVLMSGSLVANPKSGQDYPTFIMK
jgi:hypothetical protein